MKTLLVLCALAITIGFLLHPPLYLLIKKLKISKRAIERYTGIAWEVVFCFIFSFITLFILKDSQKNNFNYIYSPDVIAYLSSILFGVIIYFIWGLTIKNEWKDKIENDFLEAATWLVILWSIIMSIPITYYIFTWLAIPK